MVNIKEISGVVLAYLGDAVWELNARRCIIQEGYNNTKTNKIVKKMVNAKIQSKILEIIFDTLSDKEKELVRRAKNSNIKSYPASCTVKEYREATAFEALIAFYYETGEREKIDEIIKICREYIKEIP